MTECPHGLEKSFCHTCLHPDHVYVSGGGSAYHRRPDCRAMRHGQDRIERSGGITAAIQRVSQSRAEGMGRRRCARCFPAPCRSSWRRR